MNHLKQHLCLCSLRKQRNLLITEVTEQNGKTQVLLSEGWESLCGNAPTEINGIRNRVHPDDLHDFDLFWRKASRGRTHQQFDFRIKNCTGSYHWLLGDLVPVEDEQIQGISATFIDITARKNAELVFQQNYSLIDRKSVV